MALENAGGMWGTRHVDTEMAHRTDVFESHHPGIDACNMRRVARRDGRKFGRLFFLSKEEKSTRSKREKL